MKKAIYNKRGNQVVDTGWKEFDRQTNCIATGNVYANTQVSSFIRPWSETACNGHSFLEGHLMKYDMKQFDGYRIPTDIREILTDHNRQDSVILYMFFVINKEGHVEPFSWIVTDRNYKLIARHVTCGYRQSYTKRLLASKEIISYICN